MTREDLRLRILGKYRRIGDFADEIGYGRQQVSNIIRNENIGGLRFWEYAREKLELTYQEAWECMMCWRNKEKGEKNNDRKEEQNK